MMRIYIPSRSRFTQLADGPLRFFDRALLERVTFVVPEEEAERYGRRVADYRPGPSVRGLAYTSIGHKRQLIAELARGAGEDKFIMVDDDVLFYTRKSDENWNLRYSAAPDVEQMLATVEKLLDECASVGISSREGNNRVGVGPPLAANMAPKNTRIMRVLAYRTADFLACEHDRLKCMEDFDIQLQLLGRGLANACLYYWANGQDRTNAPGGCSLWRTREVHNASAEGLAALHPGLVRLRQKENKTDKEGLGTRLEVTISWKKAFSGEKSSDDKGLDEC